MKKYSKELNYFNAVSCLSVILVHVLSIGITSLERDSLQLFIIYLPWRIAAYVVPAFLFSGAVKMAFSFESEESENYFSYIVRRILKIFLPYCLWVIVYYLYFLKLGWVEKSFSALLKYILVGDLSAQFYYVIIVMQFYLLLPLWKLMVKKVPFYISVTTSGLITVFMYKFDGLISHLGISFEHRSRLFVTYLVFWVIGLYVGRHYDKIKESLMKYKISILFSFVPIIAVTYLLWWQYSKWLYIFDGDSLKFFTDILTIFVLLTLCVLIERSNLKLLKNLLSFIHKSSFSVFLSHCLVLQFTTTVLQNLGIKDIGTLILARVISCYTIPFILWFIGDKLKRAIKNRG